MSNQAVSFALNHMACPTLSPLAMIEAAKNLGMEAVELRNDVKENSVTDVETAKAVRAAAEARGSRAAARGARVGLGEGERARRERPPALQRRREGLGGDTVLMENRWAEKRFFILSQLRPTLKGF